MDALVLPVTHADREASAGGARGALAQEIHIAFQWVFGILGVLGAIAAVVAKSLPDVDLAAAPPVATNEISALGFMNPHLLIGLRAL